MGLLSEAQRWKKAINSDVNSASSDQSLSTADAINVEELEALGIDQRYTEFDALVDRAYDLERRLGHARTMNFFNLASGKTKPISDAMESWLSSEEYSPATQARYRKIIENLIVWCRSRRIPPVIEAIDSKRASKFLERHSDRQEKAIANERAALSRLWQWSTTQLMSKLKSQIAGHEDWIGDTGENPWRKVGAHVSSYAKMRTPK